MHGRKNGELGGNFSRRRKDDGIKRSVTGSKKGIGSNSMGG